MKTTRQNMEKEFTLNTIDEAVEEIKKGNFVIVVDDEDRENEGDFIIAAECVTPEKINFLETHGRGLICAPITKERAEELDLPMMVTNNTSIHSTPFTVSVDLLTHGCTTGISAYDRAQTILALTRPETKPEDFGRPGHIFPLRAQSRGVIRRAGHTEATIDLARLAGLYPAGALAEIKSEDGSMARLPEVVGRFAVVDARFLIAVVVSCRIFVSGSDAGCLHAGNGREEADVETVFSFAEAVFDRDFVSYKHVLCLQNARTVEENVGMGVQSFKKDDCIVVF